MRFMACGGLAAVVLLYWGASGSIAALSAEAAATPFGRSVFAVLDDDDPLIRGYGWNSLGWLGTVSNANALHIETFKRFLNHDGRALVERMETLLSKLRDKSLTELQAKAASAEFDSLRQTAQGVPEFAALLVSSPVLAESVSANDFDQIKQTSARTRPETHLARLVPAPDEAVAGLISQLSPVRK